MMLIMVTSPIKSFFMRSLDLLAASKSDWQLIGCPIAFTTGSLHARAYISRNGRYGTRDRLHWLDVGRHNHLAPFLDFVGDEFTEISGRASKHRAAQIGKPCFEFWICNADIDFLVQSFDELCGRALRSTNAVPCTCLVVRQRVAQNRNVRQHIRPRRGGYGQGAEFAGPDIFDR